MLATMRRSLKLVGNVPEFSGGMEKLQARCTCSTSNQHVGLSQPHFSPVQITPVQLEWGWFDFAGHDLHRVGTCVATYNACLHNTLNSGVRTDLIVAPREYDARNPRQ